MKINNVVVLFMISLLLGCGSGGDFTVVPVSGLVTMDGTPAAGVKLSFSPLPLEDNPNPGPYSTGVTDENGEFTLKTRYDNAGAVTGPHQVFFTYVTSKEMQRKIAEAESRVEEETAKGNSSAAAKAKKELQKLNGSLANDGVMPGRYAGREGIKFEVPSGGSDDVKFELTSDKDS